MSVRPEVSQEIIRAVMVISLVAPGAISGMWNVAPLMGAPVWSSPGVTVTSESTTLETYSRLSPRMSSTHTSYAGPAPPLVT